MRSTRDRSAQRRSGCIPQITLPAKRQRPLISAPAFKRRKWNLHGVTSNYPKNRERVTKRGSAIYFDERMWQQYGDGTMKETKCEVIWPVCAFKFQRILQFLELLVI